MWNRYLDDILYMVFCVLNRLSYSLVEVFGECFERLAWSSSAAAGGDAANSSRGPEAQGAATTRLLLCFQARKELV